MNLKKIYFVFIGLFFSFSIIMGIGEDSKIVHMNVSHKGNQIEISMDVKKGYGIQKKPLHQITVYDSEDRILFDEKKLQFNGETASEDKDYLSKINNFSITIKNGSPAKVKAKVFFCSFKDYFCSVDIVTEAVR